MRQTEGAGVGKLSGDPAKKKQGIRVSAAARNLYEGRSAG